MVSQNEFEVVCVRHFVKKTAAHLMHWRESRQRWETTKLGCGVEGALGFLGAQFKGSWSYILDQFSSFNDPMCSCASRHSSRRKQRSCPCTRHGVVPCAGRRYVSRAQKNGSRTRGRAARSTKRGASPCTRSASSRAARRPSSCRRGRAKVC